MNIGVFDSGLGGLTIFKALRKELPQYNYIYFGDNARVPYGNRSPEIIYQFTKEAVDFLFKKKCQLIIIACNSSTSTSLRKIQREYLPKFYPDLRVLGVIKPVIEKLKDSRLERIGIIGTKATIKSEAFIHEIKKVIPTAIVFQQPCPLLVPYIEDSMRNKKVLQLLLKEYLDPLIKRKINSLILACTHYGIIEKEIKNIVGSNIDVISEERIVAEKLKDYLKRHPKIERKLDKQKKVEFHFTDPRSDYKKLTKLFLNG
ncbi:MAG: Glutamate racemase [Candidatus Roizmanbacteria bacterium GW2011_GWC2_37_13]|uniref:Glutamate racemase n=1 Tax=Candidatus Roizmanbacteria bacterium GW2011_GWC2_37_13 TaxID=1618486 RepID=A0A0G0IQM5_9BACT|nr:MAG: Glutamate racemase [Candidatus Roizmanbacteria bacterium GW2011_GWC1_37_12]KKQ26489.1 MAG: Glutamate racemase [Candidatus Roizmanbacteria bacterium GW2011_GWC2_37_13]